MAPFSRNGKCRRLSSHRLDVRLHFSFLYYITLGEGVNSLGRGCNVEEQLCEGACAAKGFPYDFIAVRESYSPPENPASILLRKNWRWTEPAVGYRHFREKSHCAAMTFHRISIGIRILYPLFGKCLSDVDRIVFSVFRTRFSASEYTYSTPPKIERKSRCGATTFGGLNA